MHSKRGKSSHCISNWQHWICGVGYRLLTSDWHLLSLSAELKPCRQPDQPRDLWHWWLCRFLSWGSQHIEGRHIAKIWVVVCETKSKYIPLCLLTQKNKDWGQMLSKETHIEMFISKLWRVLPKVYVSYHIGVSLSALMWCQTLFWAWRKWQWLTKIMLVRLWQSIMSVLLAGQMMLNLKALPSWAL